MEDRGPTLLLAKKFVIRLCLSRAFIVITMFPLIAGTRLVLLPDLHYPIRKFARNRMHRFFEISTVG